MTTSSLVVGASGQVGEHCLAALQGAGRQAVGTYHWQERPGMVQLDIADNAEFGKVADRIRPSVIYFAAAMANVEACEADPELAYPTNVIGVRNAVELANRHGSKLVFFSSDYVFDGRSGPYAETATANPISAYGRQKLIAEHHVAAFAKDWLIVRTTVVYGPESQGKNFVYRLLGALREGRAIDVPSDQVGSPTYAPDLARATMELAEQDRRGIYHVCGPVRASRLDFALSVAEHFGVDGSLIRPVTTAQLKQRAPRPLDAGMVVDKAETALGRRLLDFHTGLRDMATNSPEGRRL